MDALLARLDDIANVVKLFTLIAGCAGASAIFLVGALMVAVVRAVRKDNRPPTNL